MAFIQILNGPLRARTVSVEGPRFVLGRRDECHLALPDGRVSREHAVLVELAPGAYRVQDLESENGILVNGSPCHEQDLRHEDVVRLGRTELRYLEFAADLSVPPTTDSAEDSEDDGSAEHLRTEGEKVANPDDPRTDHRERLRRLEKQLLEQESQNAQLARENARLGRECLQLTRALDDFVQRIEPRVEVSFPGTHEEPLSWPEPPASGQLSLLVRAHDQDGAAFESAQNAPGFVGSPLDKGRALELTACGLDSLPRVVGDLQELTRSDRRTRGVLLALPSGVASEGLAPLNGRLGGPVVVLDSERLADLSRNGWQDVPVEARAVALLETLVMIDDDRLRGLLTRSGILSLGLAASRTSDQEALGALVATALTEGWLGADLQPSRGREVALLAVIGSGSPRIERAAHDLRGSLTEAAHRALPGAKVTVATTSGSGAGLRLIALVGDLTLPATAEDEMQ